MSATNSSLYYFEVEVYAWLDKRGWGARASVKNADKWYTARGLTQKHAARRALAKVRP